MGGGLVAKKRVKLLSFSYLIQGDEERMDGLLEDIIRIREGARSRRDSRDEVLHRREEDPEVHTPEESSTAVVTDVPSVSPVTENGIFKFIGIKKVIKFQFPRNKRTILISRILIQDLQKLYKCKRKKSKSLLFF